MTDETDSNLDDAFKASVYWGRNAPSVERQLQDLLFDAHACHVDPFVRSICAQLFDHQEPERLTGWQAELLIEAASELIYCAKAQQELPS